MSAGKARLGEPACDVIDEIAPEPGDLCLPKIGSGGFASSALDMHLRNMGVKHVIYTGLVTNACVMLTAAGGFDLGYCGYLVTDATATYNDEMQKKTEDVLGYFVTKLVTTSEIIDQLTAAVTSPPLQLAI